MKRLPILPILILLLTATFAGAQAAAGPSGAQAATTGGPAASGAAAAPKAEAADWFWGKPITAVQWEGLVHADRRELDAVTRNYIGKDFTEELWMELQSRLYELDWFDKIEPSASPSDASRTRLVIKFVVSEKASIDTIRVSGNSGLRSNEILDVISMKAGDIFNATKTRIDELAVRRLYLERGYSDAKVSSSSAPGSVPNTVVLTFSVVEGSQVAVREIRFNGNTAVSNQTLKGQMGLKESGLFQSGAFQETKLEEDKRKIQDYYRTRGFVDAVVADVIRTMEADAKTGKMWMIVTLVIKEGRQWTFGEVKFEGNRIFLSDKLGQLVYQKPGSVINYQKFLTDKQRVDDLYYESGYIFNTLELVEKRDEATGSISYLVKITERDRAHIESIVFKGNTKTKDFVLYRELPLEVGDIFSKAKIVEGLRNLYNLQFFSAVEPEMFPGSAEYLMNLVVNVEEQSTADINFGITLSGFGEPDTFPVSGLVKWNDKNFFGNGQTFGVELNVSPTDQTLTFSFNDKWLFGRRLSGGFDLSFGHKQKKTGQDILGPIFDDDVPDPYTAPGQWNESVTTIPDVHLMPYETWDLTLGFSTGYSFRVPVGDLGIGGGFSTGFGTKTYDVDKYRPASKDLREALGIWKLGNKILGRAYLNNLDFWYNPGAGYYASERLTWAGVLPGEYQHYLKSDTKVEAYLTLFSLPIVEGFNFKWILGGHSGFSALMAKPGSALKVSDDWLSIDGIFNARGWSSLYGQEGTALWENWIELRMPLFEQFLWLDGFFDAAAVQTQEGMVDMSLSTPISTPAQKNFGALEWKNMAFSLGFGFRFSVPAFPFRFYFAKRFFYDGSDIQWKTTGSNFDFVISITQPLF